MRVLFVPTRPCKRPWNFAPTSLRIWKGMGAVPAENSSHLTETHHGLLRVQEDVGNRNGGHGQIAVGRVLRG